MCYITFQNGMSIKFEVSLQSASKISSKHCSFEKAKDEVFINSTFIGIRI